MPLNARLRALRKVAECLYRLEQPSSSTPRQVQANMRCAGLLSFGLALTGLAALTTFITGADVMPRWGWSLAFWLNVFSAVVWRHQTLRASTLPESWEAALRQALLAWHTADSSTREMLDDWATRQQLPVPLIKQWLAQERAVTPP